VHCQVSCCERHRTQDSYEPNWEVQLERLLEEHIELGCDKTSNNNTDQDTQDSSRHNHQECFIHEDSSTLLLRDTHWSQDSVFPNVVFDVWGSCDQKQEECQDQTDHTDDANNKCEHNVDGFQRFYQRENVDD